MSGATDGEERGARSERGGGREESGGEGESSHFGKAGQGEAMDRQERGNC